MKTARGFSVETQPQPKPALATTNSGLPDCSDPERAHPPGQSKSQEKCGRDTVFINPSG
jgi:hypothetical protein